MRKLTLVLGITIVLAGGFIWLRSGVRLSPVSKPTPAQNVSPTNSETPQITVIAENLDTPWAMVFLPDKSILITERPGRVRLVDGNGNLQPEPIASLSQVREVGEGGLLGITKHPDFSANNYIYLYYTYSASGGKTLNRVVRMTYRDKQLKEEKIIVDRIPGSSNHNGGRIKFGPDNSLYITTGDAENPSQAQDINALGGKILRVSDEGKAVSDNPFNNPVYSYGHRNPQGLAWDNTGQLWATEHGRSGARSGLDELNLIEKGKNYGWPNIQGDEKQAGMETPRLNSGPDVTWAPAGLAFVGNSLFFGGLRGQAVYQVLPGGENLTLKEHFKGQFGRIREVITGPDNLLYITTSNRDGRGKPNAADDKIIRINPSD
jgi:glucose/arabinose dehydrogenase